MIRWLMLGLLLSFSESDCEKNAIGSSSEKSDSGKEAAAVEAKIKATASTDHEDVYRLTCYTCVNVSDNKMCNEWAIDSPCPVGGRDFCRSLHIVDSRGQSVLVNKSCASRAECSPASVGCVPIDTQKICISCCDTSYCNVDSPTNSSNASYSRKRPWPKSSAEANSNSDDSGHKDHEQSSSSHVVTCCSLLPLLVCAFSAPGLAHFH